VACLPTANLSLTFPLETKQSGGKLLPHSDLRVGSVSRGAITQNTKGDEINTVVHLIYSNFHYNLHYSEFTFYSTTVLLLLFSDFSLDMYHVR